MIEQSEIDALRALVKKQQEEIEKLQTTIRMMTYKPPYPPAFPVHRLHGACL